MKLGTWIAVSTLVVASFVTGSYVSARSPEPQQQGGDADPAEMQRKMAEMQMQMMELAQPGAEHDLLADQEGEWTTTSELWMPPFPGMPEMPAMTSTGTMTAKLILGDRFLQQNSKFTMMGQPAEAMNVIGFDRRHGVYTMVGFDTMGTYYITAQGKPDPQTGLVVMEGVDDDPMGRQAYRFEIDHKSADEFVLTLYFTEMGGMTFEGKGHKLMEMVAKRKGAATK